MELEREIDGKVVYGENFRQNNQKFFREARIHVIDYCQKI